MTIALWCVFIAGLLPYVAAVLSKAGGQNFDNNEPRVWLAKQQGFRARANAAQQNGFEAFAFFAVAVLVAHVTRGQLGVVNMLAMLFIAARLIYLAAYLAGLGTLRSLVWAVGMMATVAIFIAVAVAH
ncbi:MAG: MAPEG family protein [Steroidobacteraceae bacterium]